MAGLKERVIDFLKEGLTTTPKERAGLTMQPSGVGTVSAFSVTEKAEKDEIVGFTKPGDCSCRRVHPIKNDKDGKPVIETGWH